MLFDVLGGFFATVLIGYLFFASIYKPDRNKSAALAGMLGGYAIWVLYFLYVGPAIMLALTGQKADTSYLTGAPFQYFLGFVFLAIPPFIVDMVQYLFGYITQIGGAIFLSWMLITSLWLSVRPKKKLLKQATAVSNSERPKWKILSMLRAFVSRYEPLLSMLYLFNGIAMVYALLVTRHAPILWADVRPTYYIMPAQAVLLFAVATLLGRARVKWLFKFRGVHSFTLVLFTLILIGNLIGSIQIKDLLFGNGENREAYPRDNAALLDSLAHINSPDFEPDREIAADPIYQLFSKR
jgi:hypothetical protein